jgi:hypothetical protein
MARMFVSAHDELVTKAEFNELAAVVRELAEAEMKTDEKVGSLADGQRRTEWAVKDLAKQVGGRSAALGVSHAAARGSWARPAGLGAPGRGRSGPALEAGPRPDRT